MHFSIRIKVALLISLLIVVVMIVNGAIVIPILENRLFKERESLGKGLAEMLAKTASEPLIFREYLVLANLATALSNQKEVRYAIIIDSTNIILSHTDSKFVDKPFEEFQGIKHPSEEGIHIAKFIVSGNENSYESKEENINEEILDIYTPVQIMTASKKLKNIGQVRIGVSIKELQNAISFVKRTVVFITLIGLTIGIISSLGLATLFVKPIALLIEAAHKVGDGDFSQQVPVTTQDELGEFTKVFNEMIKNVHAKKIIEEELRIAGEIQMGLVPASDAALKIEGLRIKGLLLPAKRV